MKKLIFALVFAALSVLPARAQLGTLQGFCDNGGVNSVTSGLPSSNFLQGNIPQCTVSIYYHDTTTLAPIFAGESSTGTLKSVQVTAGGSYSVCPTGVSFSGGGGSGATATVSCTSGAVVSVAVTNPGGGYTTAPSVSFTGGTGSGASATATIVGDLTNPFTANVDGSWRAWASIATGYDITFSGGNSPNSYTQPRTVVNVFPNAYGGTAYTIIEANGTASAPTSPVNFVNTSQVDFSISGNQIGASINASALLALQHEGIAVTDQTLMNWHNTPANLSGGSLDAGYQPVNFKTDTIGGWAAETASLAASQQIFFPTADPLGTQHIILWPITTPTSSISGGGVAYSSFAPFVGSASDYTWNTGSTHGALIWTGFGVLGSGTAGLPSYIHSTNVTSVYWGFTGASVSDYLTTNEIGGYNTGSPICSTGSWVPNVSPGGLWFQQPLYNSVPYTGSTAQTLNYATATCSISSASGTEFTNPAGLISGVPYMIVYYTTDPAPPVTYAINVEPPLVYANNELSLGLPFDSAADTGSVNAYAVTLPYWGVSTGSTVKFTTANANTSAAPTLTVSGLGSFTGMTAATIVGPMGLPLCAGDIPNNSSIGDAAFVIFGSDGKWHLQNPHVCRYSTGTTLQVANAGTTGTTANTLTKLTGAPSTAVITATTDTSGIVGVTVTGAGTTGTETIQLNGQASLVLDGATTAGDYVQTSSTTAGNGHDAGATCPASGQVIGRVLTTNAAGGTYAVNLGPNGCGGSGGSLPSGTTNQLLYYASAGVTVTPLNLGTNLSITSGTLNASGGGGIALQNAGTPLGTINTLNCSTGLTCTYSSGTGTIVAGTGSAPAPFSFIFSSYGVLTLLAGSGGSGYTGTGTCTLSGGNLYSGTADTCTVTLSGGVVQYALIGTAQYTVPPVLTFSGFTGGTGAVAPTVGIGTETINAYATGSVTPTYTGTDAAVVVQSALNSLQYTGGTLFFKSGWYNCDSVTTETVSYTTTDYCFGIPATNLGASYPTFRIIGESSMGGSQNAPATSGVVFNVTPAAVTAAGTNSLAAWWGRPSTAFNSYYPNSATLYWGDRIEMQDISVQFPNNGTANLQGINMLEETYLVTNRVMVGFVTPPTAVGASGDVGIITNGNQSDGTDLRDTWIEPGFDRGIDINTEHSNMKAVMVYHATTGFAYGEDASRNGAGILNTSEWSNVHCYATIHCIVAGTHINSGAQLDIVGLNIEYETSGAWTYVDGFTTGTALGGTVLWADTLNGAVGTLASPFPTGSGQNYFSTNETVGASSAGNTASVAGTASQFPQTYLCPNILTGNSCNWFIGANKSAPDGAYISWHNVGGTGSASNQLSINPASSSYYLDGLQITGVTTNLVGETQVVLENRNDTVGQITASLFNRTGANGMFLQNQGAALDDFGFRNSTNVGYNFRWEGRSASVRNSLNTNGEFQFLDATDTGCTSSPCFFGEVGNAITQFEEPLRTTPTTYSTLPTCAAGTEGSQRAITDSTTATWGATIAGGGTTHVLAYCDGTHWTVMAM